MTTAEPIRTLYLIITTCFCQHIFCQVLLGDQKRSWPRFFVYSTSLGKLGGWGKKLIVSYCLLFAPIIRAMPERKRFFPVDVFPLLLMLMMIMIIMMIMVVMMCFNTFPWMHVGLSCFDTQDDHDNHNGHGDRGDLDNQRSEPLIGEGHPRGAGGQPSTWDDGGHLHLLLHHRVSSQVFVFVFYLFLFDLHLLFHHLVVSQAFIILHKCLSCLDTCENI